MSLLDDVSIVVTPNGYKAGTLYGVLPTYAEGIDLVNNGGFDSGSNWSTPSSWEIIDGKLEGTNVNAVSTTQGGFLFLGKTFLVTYTLSDYVQGNVRVYLGGTQPTSNRSANGTYSEYITITTANTTLYIQGISNFTGNIDNISVKEATIDNLPRVDYTDGTSSLLVEPQRTNTVTYSEDFSQWTIDGNASITSNATTSPDGTENATKLIAGSSSGRQAIKLNNTSSGDLAVSVFAKKGEYSVIQLSDARNATAFINFDLLNGSVGSSSVMTGEIVSLGNDWYKCIATYNSASNIISMRLSIAESSTSARLVNFSGNGTDGIYIWGAQLEDSYPTSYIKTSGSTVTRNQETYEKTGISDLINSEEGVLFVEMAALSDDVTERYISLSDGSLNNRVYIQFTTTTNQIKMGVTKGGSTQASRPETVSDVTEFNKLAISYSQDLFKFYVNGSLVFTDSSGDTFTANTLNRLNFDVGTSGFSKFFGKVRKLQVYKTTDIDLAALTS